MKNKRWTLALALALSGCPEIEIIPLSDMAVGGSDQQCAMPPDLSTQPAACKAAQGISGDVTTCVDFDKVTSLDALRAMNWTINKNGMGNECWEIISGKIQVKDFSSFSETCQLKLPTFDFTLAANQKYQRVTLAINQKVDMNESQQKAQVMLGTDDPLKRLLHQTTGVQPRQQTIINVTRADLPAMAAGMFQPLFKLSSSTAPGAGYLGWQIESIAVIASP